MKKILFLFFLCVSLFSFAGQKAFAASATMNFSPQSGSFDKPFTVNLMIDGHGEKFNAAQATVVIPSGLAIKELTLGDCNFSFLKTPTVQHPSFTGIILSKYSTKCTVYTLTLIPVAKGTTTLSLSHPSIKRFGDAAEIFSSKQNATYTLTSALNSPSVLGTQTTKNLYTVNLTVLLSKDKPLGNATVTLTPVSKKDQIKSRTDVKGIATFANVKADIYSVIVEKDKNKVGETIINVSGPNHILTLGINLEAQRNNPLLKNVSLSPFLIGGILILGILLGIIIPKVLNKFKKEKIQKTKIN